MKGKSSVPKASPSRPHTKSSLSSSPPIVDGSSPLSPLLPSSSNGVQSSSFPSGGGGEKVLAYDHVGVLGTHIHLTEEAPSHAVRTYRAYRTHAPAYHNSSIGSPTITVTTTSADGTTKETSSPVSNGNGSSAAPSFIRLFSMFDVVLVALCLLLQVPAVNGGSGGSHQSHQQAASMSALNGTSSFSPSSTLPLSSSTPAATFGGHGWIPEVRAFLSATFPLFCCRTLETVISEFVRFLAWIFEIAGGVDGATWFTTTELFKTARFRGGFYHTQVCGSAGGNAGGDLCPESSWLAPTLAQPSIFWPCVFIAFILIKIPTRMRRIAVEEVMVVEGVGIQLTTRNFTDRVVKQEFIDLSVIRGIVIHEAYFRHRVIFVLGVLFDGSNEFKVLFEESLPRLAPLRNILVGIRGILYKEQTTGPTLADLGAVGAPEVTRRV